MPAIIFDMDGVLIDSEPFWQAAEVEVFGALGVPLTLQMCTETMGLRIDAVVEHWFQRHPWASASKADVERRVVGRVGEIIEQRGVPMVGALELLAALRATGVPLALCSSSASFLIDLVCSKFVIAAHFDVVQSAEVCTHGKPHPEPYLATAARLQLTPGECVVIEDSLNGMKSARAAGMKVVGVTTNPKARDDGLCDVVYDELRQVDVGSLLSLCGSTRSRLGAT